MAGRDRRATATVALAIILIAGCVAWLIVLYLLSPGGHR